MHAHSFCRFSSILGLILIAFGTGGIKPCVAAFGGDQFLAHQTVQLQQFFSIFYMSINAGSLISMFVTPIFREDVNCSHRGDCFPLAFGMPAILMVIALVLFVAGKSLYRIVPPAKGNIVFSVVGCIFVSNASARADSSRIRVPRPPFTTCCHSRGTCVKVHTCEIAEIPARRDGNGD